VKRDEHKAEQDKIYLELMRQREVPLRCPKHGWVGSNQYALYIDDDMMSNEKITWIRGGCKVCGEIINRPLHPKYTGFEMSILLVQICMILANEKRLIDKRGLPSPSYVGKEIR